MKTTLLLVLVVGAYGQSKPATKPLPKPPVLTTCVPTPSRGPSLELVDSKGKCGSGYKGMKDKDGKVLYCVNSKPYVPPVVCKTGAYSAKPPAPAKGKK